MKIYFIEWKYILSNEDIFLSNENIFYRMKIYFIEWKYILTNENIFYRMKIYFIEWKYILSNENISISNCATFRQPYRASVVRIWISCNLQQLIDDALEIFFGNVFFLHFYCTKGGIQKFQVCVSASPIHLRHCLVFIRADLAQLKNTVNAFKIITFFSIF